MPLVDRVGLGGGGSLYDPQVSWWNPDLVFVACDMTGLYRSIDGGRHWTMLDTRIVQGSNRLSVAIHPVQPGLLGYHPFQGVKESTDGLIWNNFPSSTALNAEKYPTTFATAPSCLPLGTPNQNNTRELVVTALSYCPDKNGRILAGTECGIFLYDEQTPHWRWVYPLDAMGNPARYPTYDLGVSPANAAEVISFIALPNPHVTGQWVYFCATSCFILRSDNSGLTWTDISNNLPTRALGVFYPGLPSDIGYQTVDPNYKPSRIRGFAGGNGSATSVGGIGNHFILYATVATSLTGSTIDGGVYYYDSLDDPSSQPNLTPIWRSAMVPMGSGINFSPVGTTPIGPPGFSDDRNGRVIPRYERLAVSRNDPHTLYVSALNTLYRYPTIYQGTYTRPGNQGSVTWMGAYEGFQTNTTPLQPNPMGPIVPGTMVTNLQGQWIEDDLDWGFGGSANSLTVDPNSSDRVFLSNTAAVHMTDNGTANPPSWVCRYTDQVPDNTGTGAPWWRTTGLDITSTWHYYVSPANRHYIANTDIGLSQSIDGGDTWRSFHPGCHAPAPAPPPWSQCSLDWSNVYDLAFEGTNIWAAVSKQHDLPYDLNHTKAGTVLSSTNDGNSWQELTPVGLPLIPGGTITPPVTSVVRGPGVIYAALWGGGVFALNDGAASWSEVKVAAPAAGNRAALTGLRAYRLQLSGATLYCVVSDGSADAGLYSCNPNPGSNQGWQPIGPVGQYRVIDFALNAVGPTVVNQYLCTADKAASLGQPASPGAVYKLVNQAWKDLNVPFSTANPPLHDSVVVFALSFIGDMVYASSITHGIWCAQLTEVNSYTGTGNISWVQYQALPFTPAQRITELGDPTSGSSTLMITSYGGGVGRVQRSFYLVVDRGEFTQGEIKATAGIGGIAPYPSALFAVLDGFLPIELMGARTAADLLANFQVQVTPPGAGVTVALNSSGPKILLEDPSLPAELFQRVAFPLTISIDESQAFAQGAPQSIDISATFGATIGQRYTCKATIRSTVQPVPFMQDGSTPWLSADVAAFQVAQGDTVFGQMLTAQTSPTAFIQAILNHIRTNPTSWQTEFDTLRDGPKSVLQLSQYVPGTTNPPLPTYNFALARVHNADPTNKATAFNVFFRLFNTAWTGFEYDPNQTYRTATSGPAPIAVLGVKTALGEGGALVSVPCFANDRVQPNAMLSTQPDPYNLASAANGNEIDPGSVQVYGCWLDFNQQTAQFPNQQTQLFPQYPDTKDGQFTGTLLSIQQLIRGRHQCLVVEIYRTADPIATGATPGTSDRLSQRNLFIVGCDNPGPPPAHLVQHSFEIMVPLHRKRSQLDGDEVRGERQFMDTDELVFMGADLPGGSRAQLFLPTVDIEDLLTAQGSQLRAKAYRRVDDHTVEFDPSEVSYLSLPPGHARNIPGLLSIQLPEGVRRDQEFRCRVQQWSDHRVLGQFELRIPVAVPQDLLLEEENKLAVLRYIQLATPAGDAWRDVLDRYLEQVADRVRGLGGDPDSIEPSGAGVGAPGQGLKGYLATLIRIVSEHPVAFLIGGLALVLLLAWLRYLRRRIARG